MVTKTIELIIVTHRLDYHFFLDPMRQWTAQIRINGEYNKITSNLKKKTTDGKIFDNKKI
jgi:hypothetical protein